jgi:hypothetical protein
MDVGDPHLFNDAFKIRNGDALSAPLDIRHCMRADLKVSHLKALRLDISQQGRKHAKG